VSLFLTFLPSVRLSVLDVWQGLYCAVVLFSFHSLVCCVNTALTADGLPSSTYSVCPALLSRGLVTLPAVIAICRYSGLLCVKLIRSFIHAYYSVINLWKNSYALFLFQPTAINDFQSESLWYYTASLMLNLFLPAAHRYFWYWGRF